jgi:hypothetical protein
VTGRWEVRDDGANILSEFFGEAGPDILQIGVGRLRILIFLHLEADRGIAGGEASRERNE